MAQNSRRKQKQRIEYLETENKRLQMKAELADCRAKAFKECNDTSHKKTVNYEKKIDEYISKVSELEKRVENLEHQLRIPE